MNQQPSIEKLPLSIVNQWLLGLASFFLVAFGQPALISLNGAIAAVVGFALFWRILLAYPLAKHRFYLASFWFCAVQLVQLSWFISHPYWYIYAVYIFLSAFMGVQFGIISLFIQPNLFAKKGWISSLGLFFLASLWTLFEWMRLFLLSGFSWNPVGLALANNHYSLQAASIGGVFALSFWVILVNLLVLRAFVQKRLLPVVVCLTAIALPYLYGIAHIAYQDHDREKPNLTAMLVQTGFSPEEIKEFPNEKGRLQHIIGEWKTILAAGQKHHGLSMDLIVLPELVVPYGTYSDIYPLLEVKKAFYEVLGSESLSLLPGLEYPFFSLQQTASGPQFFVNNAYWAQALANVFQADILLGLEDVEDVGFGRREYYSSAIFIHPQQHKADEVFTAERYSKRVLLPMGEYIPFEACRELAQRYGVFGSFTCGKEAVVMNSKGIPFSPSICYEETFGNLMREGKQKGADLYINLTSDVWYPNSTLPKQHLEHARLRTVENGVPLIRACNTGITAAIDSFGRDIETLGGKEPEKVEWIPDALLVNVPIHSYPTLYSKYGDTLIVAISAFFLFAVFPYRNRFF
jgi:apolipoprotein N-acyltransferase